jgi:hypothetical protein
VIAEVIGWMGHSAEEIKTMKDHISALETREE